MPRIRDFGMLDQQMCVMTRTRHAKMYKYIYVYLYENEYV